MEFPVYVASDCCGEKINVALRYNPRGDTIGHLYANAESACALFTIQHVHDDPPQPFAYAYVYNDVRCQWDLLESQEQLSPCCQVYVFRCGKRESVGPIPEPFNLVAALQQADAVARRGSSPRRFPTASESPLRVASDRWAPPPEPVDDHDDDVEVNDGFSSVIREKDMNNQQRVNRVVHLQGACHANATQLQSVSTSLSPVYAPQQRADVPTVPFGTVRSHRFRLQLLSPPLSADLKTPKNHHQIGDSSPQKNILTQQLSHMKDTYSDFSTKTPGPPIQAPPRSTRMVEVEIPRTWYNSSSVVAATTGVALTTTHVDHLHTSIGKSAPSSISRYGSSTQYSEEHRHTSSASRFPVSTSILDTSRRPSHPHVVPSTPRQTPTPVLLSPATASALKRLGTPPLHPSPYGSAAPSRRGSSILREERARVEERMRMNVDDLRVSLQEEDRGYERTTSSSRRYRS